MEQDAPHVMHDLLVPESGGKVRHTRQQSNGSAHTTMITEPKQQKLSLRTLTGLVESESKTGKPESGVLCCNQSSPYYIINTCAYKCLCTNFCTGRETPLAVVHWRKIPRVEA